MILKNHTVYEGSIKLKLEKNPYHNDRGRSMLNKVYLDLGFTKLCSRLYYRKPITLDSQKRWLINTSTGGKIGVYFPDEDCPLYNSFIYIDYMSGIPKTYYIGDAMLGWFYYQNNMKVNPAYPKSVATVFKDGIVEGFYGYSHRAGQTFKVGDRLFDATYKPKEQDYEEWEWAGYEDKYKETLEKSDSFERERLLEDGIASIIPFNRRGWEDITTYDEAEQAAYNFSKYVN